MNERKGKWMKRKGNIKKQKVVWIDIWMANSVEWNIECMNERIYEWMKTVRKGENDGGE